jgi:acyl carrier protein
VLYTVGILGLKQRSGSHRINLLVKFDEHITPTAKQAIINRIYKTTEQIPLHKRPTKFFEVDQIPLTQLGKVKHRELLGLYDSGKLILNPINIKSDKKNTDTNKLDKDLLLIVRQCFAKAFEVDVKDIHDDTDFITDLGGSSIDYYTILNEINHATGKEIKLIGNKILITPIDFTIYLMQTYN